MMEFGFGVLGARGRAATRFSGACVIAALVLGLGPAGAQENAPPAAVTEAAKAAEVKPSNVTVGFFINDIQNLDYRTNSYGVDLYIWFRWMPRPDFDPIKSFEFMNTFDPSSEKKTVLFDAPKAMPDGSLYNSVRYQGHFSTKFRLEKYPFDTQTLAIVVEDSVSAASVLVYEPDKVAVTINPAVSLPGYKLGAPELSVLPYIYPTDFGDRAMENAESFSRALVSIPITRPPIALTIKTFVPIFLILICAALVFFIHPLYVEGRIGLAITALLTLVALQLTAASAMPEIDYLTLLDKFYLMTYAFIIAALFRVVVTSKNITGQNNGEAIAAVDHRWGFGLTALYLASAAAMVSWTVLR